MKKPTLELIHYGMEDPEEYLGDLSELGATFPTAGALVTRALTRRDAEGNSELRIYLDGHDPSKARRLGIGFQGGSMVVQCWRKVGLDPCCPTCRTRGEEVTLNRQTTFAGKKAAIVFLQCPGCGTAFSMPPDWQPEPLELPDRIQFPKNGGTQ